mmetsp:Transcript_56130/g.157504  ORF Transcript_56130/g.157504 Transcript_56130/m.157504 type:complete len:372 (-) Transcript_56130:69-1184(-)
MAVVLPPPPGRTDGSEQLAVALRGRRLVQTQRCGRRRRDVPAFPAGARALVHRAVGHAAGLDEVGPRDARLQHDSLIFHRPAAEPDVPRLAGRARAALRRLRLCERRRRRELPRGAPALDPAPGPRGRLRRRCLGLRRRCDRGRVARPGREAGGAGSDRWCALGLRRFPGLVPAASGRCGRGGGAGLRAAGSVADGRAGEAHLRGARRRVRRRCAAGLLARPPRRGVALLLLGALVALRLRARLRRAVALRLLECGGPRRRGRPRGAQRRDGVALGRCGASGLRAPRPLPRQLLPPLHELGADPRGPRRRDLRPHAARGLLRVVVGLGPAAAKAGGARRGEPPPAVGPHLRPGARGRRAERPRHRHPPLHH